MAHRGLMDKLIHNSLERWTGSKALMEKLVEEMCKHSNISERLLEIIYSSKTKDIRLKTKIQSSPKHKRTYL